MRGSKGQKEARLRMNALCERVAVLYANPRKMGGHPSEARAFPMLIDIRKAAPRPTHSFCWSFVMPSESRLQCRIFELQIRQYYRDTAKKFMTQRVMRLHAPIWKLITIMERAHIYLSRI